MSKILNNIGIDYVLQNVRADGNCFYHAISKQLNETVPFNNVRNIVADAITDDDVVFFNAINNKNWSKEKLIKRLKHTGKNCIWADSIEINALIRSIPHLGLIIFDDESNTINKIELNQEKKNYLYLLRQNLHYQSVVLSDINKKRINKILKLKDNYTLKKISKHENIILYTSLTIPLWIILFQLFDRSLKNW